MMSNHSKALSFTVWDTGDESSMSNTKRLSDIISAYQQHLADNEGREIGWTEAVDLYFQVEIRRNVDQLLTEAKEDLRELHSDSVLPQ